MSWWFGDSWGAPVCEPGSHVDTPVNTPCARCREPIRARDQGVVSPLFDMNDAGPPSVRTIAYHLDCYLKGILPHGPECPHCRGVEPRLHNPACQRNETGLCTCIPMPEGQ